MSLVLSSDQKTLTIVPAEEEVPTRAKLLANREFCTNVAVIAGYLNGLKFFGHQDKIFQNDMVRAQFDAAIAEDQDEEEGDSVFSVQDWYASVRAQYDDKDTINWLESLTAQELKRKGFCQSLLNCIEMEESMETAQYNGLQRACFTGRNPRGTTTAMHPFFSQGGITAPDRKK